MDPHNHDPHSVEQMNLSEEDKSARDTTSHVTDNHHDGSHTPSSGAVRERNMNAFLVPRSEQDNSDASANLHLEPNMVEQEPSTYYACLMQCIDRVTKPYRDTISRQNHKLSEAESNLSHERGRLRIVEDVGLELKDQNETILGKNVQLEKEVYQLQMHKAIVESRLSELSKEIMHLQDRRNGLKDSTMEKVGSLKASCLEANGELDKFREHLVQYGDDIQDSRMSLEQWQSERDTLQTSLEQAIENTCDLQRQQVCAMAELQQKYESATGELEVLRQRSEAYASTNDQLQQMMQQLASDHQSQMFETEKTIELLENEVKLLTMAKDHHHGEFEAQIASVEELLGESMFSLDKTKKDLDQTNMDLSNAEIIIRTREESIRSLEEQTKKPETRNIGVSTEDDTSFDLCVSFYALQGQNHAQQDQIDSLQIQNRILQGQNKAFQGESRDLLGQNRELVSQENDLRGEISDLKRRIQKLADERGLQNETIESEIRVLESKLDASVAETLKQQDKVKELMTQLSESESKKKELKAELKSSQSKDKARTDLEAWKQDQMAKNQDNRSEIQQLKTALEDAQSRLTMQTSSLVSSESDTAPLRTPSIGAIDQGTEPVQSLEHHVKGQQLTNDDVLQASSAKNKKTSSAMNKEAFADKENTPPSIPQEATSTPTRATRAQSSTTTKGKSKAKIVDTKSTSATNKGKDDDDDDDDDFEEPP
ncbi:hypothetical protein BGZ93_008951, partial [Podila epicladia]